MDISNEKTIWLYSLRAIDYYVKTRYAENIKDFIIR